MIEIPTTGPEMAALRKSIGISQRQMATALEVSPTLVCFFENNDRDFPAEFQNRYRQTLAELAERQAKKARAAAEVLA